MKSALLFAAGLLALTTSAAVADGPERRAGIPAQCARPLQDAAGTLFCPPRKFAPAARSKRIAAKRHAVRTVYFTDSPRAAEVSPRAAEVYSGPAARRVVVASNQPRGQRTVYFDPPFTNGVPDYWKR